MTAAPPCASGPGETLPSVAPPALLQALFDNAGFGAAVLDAAGRCLLVNAALTRILGGAPADYHGRTITELMRPAPARRVMAMVRRVLSTGQAVRNATFSGRSAEQAPGTPLRVWTTQWFPLNDPAGSVGVVVQDVTDRHLALRALRASEARFRGVFDSDAVGISIFDAATGQTLAINDRFLRITGHSREDFEAGRWNCRALTPPEFLPVLDRAVAQMRETGRCDPFEKGFLRQDGSTVAVRVQASPLPGAPRGRVVVFVTDITEERHTAAALAASEARLGAILDQMPVGVALAEVPSGRPLYHNVRAKALLGRPDLPPGGAGGHAWAGALRPGGTPLPPEHHPISRAARLGEVVEQEEMLFRRADGSVSWFAVSAARVHDRSGRALAVSTFTDISERKAAERRQAVLTAELRHRVKNALAVVQAVASQTLSRSDSLDEFREAFGGRLAAMARAQDVAFGSGGPEVELRALVETGLGPFLERGEDAVSVRGDQVPLPARMAPTLALLLHEMATNATKYGALRAEVRGRLEVAWRLEPGPEGERDRLLCLEWREECDPPPPPPPEDRPEGFGRRLIRHATRHDLRGEAVAEFRPAGMCWRLRFPVPALATGHGT